MDWLGGGDNANPERQRIAAASKRTEHWRRWGPYLSDRQWGTVREDYSPYGNAWEYFPFDHAIARTYRWGEDGLFGISDNHQRLCFSTALWNGADPLLKERLFGLTGNQGNHGEDVKEYYYHLDNTPSHSYMKALYKYPHAAFPYERLLEENRNRGRADREFELFDTGIFENDAYFDVTIEYAKKSIDDILIRITATNRGKVVAPLHIVPQFWYRNEWSWKSGVEKPSLMKMPDGGLRAHHPTLGEYWIYTDGAGEALFTENETNYERVFGASNPTPYRKDGIDCYVVRGQKSAVNPAQSGTKMAFHYAFDLAPGETKTVRLRLSDKSKIARPIDTSFDTTFEQRANEADRFYHALNPYKMDEESRIVQRRAFAGLLWSKQFYNYVVRDWLEGDPLMPPPPKERLHGRNSNWRHLYNDDILSMPDSWEYPWYASWDLAFHVIPLAMIDPEFAKRQLVQLTREWYMHPNGQIPAYEWAFGDVNPPVHAWAAMRVYKIEQKMYGYGDVFFLERVFQKLLLNFTWWVNRKDAHGNNVFQGGFLGLDNIGVFDRSAVLPTGGHLNQADGTSWMGVYSLNMLAIALELARHNPVYEDIASKFFEHFLYIADAMNSLGDDETGLWDEEDGLYYDQLILPDATRIPLKVRSLVGLVPLFAIETLTPDMLAALPRFNKRLNWFIANRPELSENVACMDMDGIEDRRLLAIVTPERLRRILERFLSEDEFLSPFGLRSISKYHKEHPYVLQVGGARFQVDYEPAESTSGLFGGNSNWRGPVWFPLNYLFIEALQKFHWYLGDGFKLEYPSGSGQEHTLWEVAQDLSRRMTALFLPGADGARPCYGTNKTFQNDPHWNNLLVFHEFFNGDTGEGLGASHQTGWTGLVAKLVQQYAEYAESDKPPLEWDFEVPLFGHPVL